MITIAVFDSDPLNQNEIKKIIIDYSVQRHVDLDILWFSDNFSKDSIKKYARSIQIAFISLDFDESEKVSEVLYYCNEDCRIIFYSGTSNELEPLLRFRPRAYYYTNEEDKSLFEVIDDIFSELKNSSCYYYHENKREILLIPLRKIMYFQSDLKYVNIYLRTGKQERVYAKLSEIEAKLTPDFIRIHKSYYVNRKYIHSVNKSKKLVVLSNAQELPISEANYKTVIAAFNE